MPKRTKRALTLFLYWPAPQESMPEWYFGRLSCSCPSSAQKGKSGPRQMDLPRHSAEGLQSLTSQETNSTSSSPMPQTLPSPQRGTTKVIRSRQLYKIYVVKASRLQSILDCAPHCIPERWPQCWKPYSQDEPVLPSSGLVLRSLIRNWQPTLTCSFIIKGMH